MKDIKKRKKTALGRGLEALIPNFETPDFDSINSTQDKKKDYFLCDIEKIHPNRYQPRKKFNQKELEELAQSIKEQGIIQPLIVNCNDDKVELIAGERRLRAAKLAGLDSVPVVVKETSDLNLLEYSIIENIQRKDLNPIEEADAYKCLISKFNLTQEEIAKKVGKSRSAITNFLRLLNLPDLIKADIINEILSMGHARALLGADTAAQQEMIWRIIKEKKLSVRETENLINKLKKENKTTINKQETKEDIYFKDHADNLSKYFGTKVQITKKGEKGKLFFEFYSNEDLDRLLNLLKNLQ